MDYLRKMCRDRVIKTGSNLVKTMVQQKTLPEKTLVIGKTFSNKYLTVKSP